MAMIDLEEHRDWDAFEARWEWEHLHLCEPGHAVSPVRVPWARDRRVEQERVIPLDAERQRRRDWEDGVSDVR